MFLLGPGSDVKQYDKKDGIAIGETGRFSIITTWTEKGNFLFFLDMDKPNKLQLFSNMWPDLFSGVCCD